MLIWKDNDNTTKLYEAYSEIKYHSDVQKID